jgi:hypothetical protein
VEIAITSKTASATLHVLIESARVSIPAKLTKKSLDVNDVVDVDFAIEEAFKFVMSGGIVGRNLTAPVALCGS